MRKPIMAGALVVAFGLGAAATPTLSAVEKVGPRERGLGEKPAP